MVFFITLTFYKSYISHLRIPNKEREKKHAHTNKQKTKLDTSLIGVSECRFLGDCRAIRHGDHVCERLSACCCLRHSRTHPLSSPFTNTDFGHRSRSFCTSFYFPTLCFLRHSDYSVCAEQPSGDSVRLAEAPCVNATTSPETSSLHRSVAFHFPSSS